MIYIARFVLWFIIIVFISWIVHRFVGEAISNKKVKPFIGIITFLVIVLTPMGIAKVAQVYYCWKYQPFYEIIEPLGDDFEGFYEESHVAISLDLMSQFKEYENIIKIADYAEDDNNVKTLNYNRYYLGDANSSRCLKYTKNELSSYKFNKLPKHLQEERKKYNDLLDYFAKQNKCIAKKIIPASKVSRYKRGGSVLENKILFVIPGVVKARYHKSAMYTDTTTKKPYAWGAFISVKWDLYGVLGREGAKPRFNCSYDFSLDEFNKIMMIKKTKGNNYGN